MRRAKAGLGVVGLVVLALSGCGEAGDTTSSVTDTATNVGPLAIEIANCSLGDGTGIFGVAVIVSTDEQVHEIRGMELNGTWYSASEEVRPEDPLNWGWMTSVSAGECRVDAVDIDGTLHPVDLALPCSDCGE